MRIKHVNINSISVCFALLTAVGAGFTAIYHAIKSIIKGILAVAGVFKGVKKAHKRIDILETQIKQLSDVISPMAPQMSAIYELLINKRGEA